MGIITTFLRSSSYNCWDICPFKFWISYGLGMREPSGLKAVKGNIVHKALELLGRKKLALQRGCKTFSDQEVGREFTTESFDPELAIDIGWEHYKIRETHLDLSQKDFRDCHKWLMNGLQYRNGLYSPLNHEIVQPEQYFEFIIDKPWAEYAYTLPDGNKLQGYLSIKGTVDLVTRHQRGYLHYLDWKTGQVKDWATGKDKDYTKLCNDPQLRLYHYALSRLYPDEKDIFVTIFYVQFLKPFTICFTKDDLAITEAMLRKRFETIRNTVRPRRVKGNAREGFKCRFCHFAKAKHAESTSNVCDHIWGELCSLGMERVTEKYLKIENITSYGSGGGRSDKTLAA